jgi:uncharacterized protein
MLSLPIIGQAAPLSPLAPTGEAPWLHVVPGSPPLVLLVHGSQLYEVDAATAERLEAGDPAALAELRPLATAGGALRLDEVTPPSAPTALSLNLAQTCNLGCHYCYADEGRFQGQPRLMPEPIALAAIDRLIDGAPGGQVTVGFIGGEPFLHRELIHRAVAHARARGAGAGVTVRFSVTTNGTLLREQDVALLREHAFAVSVSLDGDAATHDRHRPARDGRGSHARALAALAPLLADPGAARLAARATVTRDDLRVDERVRALLALGFHEAGVSPARTGPAAELLLRDEDWPRFLVAMVDAAEAELARVRAAGGRAPFRFGNLAIALKQIHRGACRPLPCGAGYNYLSVSAEGHYFTCHRTIDDPRFAVGDAAHGPDLAARGRFVATRHVDRQEPCRRCWARYLCGGGCHAEVAVVGRAGCDYIRGWLDYCLRAYTAVAGELPHLLTASEGLS